MNTNMWVIIIVVVAFLGFMIGYAVPPFLEVGFSQVSAAGQGGTVSEEELRKQYEELYKDEGSGSTSE